jgi:hypothetical protein
VLIVIVGADGCEEEQKREGRVQPYLQFSKSGFNIWFY